GVAEFKGILPPALCDERGIHAPVLAGAAERELALSTAGYALLDENFVGRQILPHLREGLLQLPRRADRKGFDVRVREEPMVDRRLQDHGVGEFAPAQLGQLADRGCPWSVDVQFRRALIRQSLVERESCDFGWGRRQPEYRAQLLVMR